MGVVDVAFPAHSGARFFKVDPHDYQNVISQLLCDGVQLPRIFHCLRVVVDGAWTNYGQ